MLRGTYVCGLISFHFEIFADRIMCKRSNRLSENQCSRDFHHISESAIFKRPWYSSTLDF